MLTGAARLAIAIVSTVIAPFATAWAAPAVTFDVPHTAGCGPNNVEGWQFETTASITVSALGVYDSSSGDGPYNPGNGLDFTIPVGLYDSECKQLASVMVPAGTTATLIADYRYVGIAPLVLAGGQMYRIAAVMRCDDFTPQFQTPTGFSVDSSLTAVETRRIAGGSSLACPTQTSPVIGFAPNFLIGPACGNGVVQDAEECDDGNTANGDCCSSTCQYESDGLPCPDDGQTCTDDLCNATGICTHDLRPAGTECRPAPGECDAAESCDGDTPSCPPDEFMPNGTPCSDDGLFCSGAETCQAGYCTSAGDPCAGDICDEDADQCVAPSPTTTRTATATSIATASATVTASATPTSTASVTRTPANTPTGSPAVTPTRTHVGTPTGSAVSTATATVAVTPTPSVTASAHGTVTPSPTPTHTLPPGGCTGDCDGDGDVSIGELITGVNIVLGNVPIDRCSAFDSSENGSVEINELIMAVNNALNGCA